MRNDFNTYRQKKRGSIWNVLNEFDEVFGIPSRMSLNRELNRPTDVESSFEPYMEMKEQRDAYVVQAELEGVRDEDLRIELIGSQLTVSGVRRQSHQFQWAYGSFSRTFFLPEDIEIDRIGAMLKAGALRIFVPKTTAVKPRRIHVRPNDSWVV